MSNHRKVTLKEWHAEGVALFGDEQWDWKFVCPSCGHVASPRDWKGAGAGKGQVGFSCVGRAPLSPTNDAFSGKRPCNYAGGGLITLNPVTVILENGIKQDMFEFAREGQ